MRCPRGGRDVKNVLQAIAFNREKLAHGQPAEQAVALCWLLHTIGDLHQPLHATAAFSSPAFDPASDPHGDQGGNAIHLGEHRNLHALWDAVPTPAPRRPTTPTSRLISATTAPRPGAETRRFAAGRQRACRQGKVAAGEKDPQQWAREGYELAKDKVYTAEIRQQILAADRGQDKRNTV